MRGLRGGAGHALEYLTRRPGLSKDQLLGFDPSLSMVTLTKGRLQQSESSVSLGSALDMRYWATVKLLEF